MASSTVTYGLQLVRWRFLFWYAEIFAPLLCAKMLAAEQITMTTWYPAPVGVYQSLITTGGNAASPVNTILSRDAGRVGIGTTNPGAPLTVYGGGEILRIQKNTPGGTGTGYIQFVDSDGVPAGYIGKGGGGAAMQISYSLGPISIGPKSSPGSNIASALYIGQLPGQIDIGGTAYGGGAKSYINFDDSNWDVEGGVGKIDPTSGDVTLWSGTAGIRLTTANGGGIKTNDNIFVNGQVVQTSDARLKKDIAPISGSLRKILSLRGVQYRWKDEKKDPGFKIGLLAQDVEKVFPEAVKRDDRGYSAVNYSSLIAPLINAVKEQQAEIQDLKACNRIQQTEIDRLNAAFAGSHGAGK